MSSISPFERNDGDEATNKSAPIKDCPTCGGDKFVTVRLRAPQQTAWMADHGLEPSKTEFHEEVAGCPDCNPVVVDYWVHGRPFRSMDAAATREAMRQ